MFEKECLQLFADGEGAGAQSQAAATGVTDADAGHQQALRAEEGQAAAAEESGKSLWERIKADPEANRELQELIRARLKTERNAEAELSRLTPVMEQLARRFGMDPKAPDPEALVRALETQTPDARPLRQHLQQLHEQGERFRKVLPGFDLRRELQNPLFARLTAPHVGMSVEDAYFAVHRRAFQSAAMTLAARRTAQKLSSAVASGSLRPAENGISRQGPSVAGFDYRAMSPQQRNALKARIKAGEKIYP